ncbi:MAG: peptidylprolyl isomerase [Azoarcus sp.]|jgi:peptidyl-prolyl cis-trans isomerase SurA|nr:peptidylprolyl isomerase [Azoarcus sp.]
MNRIPPRPRTRAVAGSTCALLLALLLSTSAISAVQEVDRIAAVVNSEVITVLQLNERVAQIRRQLQGQNVQLPPDEILERQILEQLIVERAQLQLARETALQIDDAVLDHAIERVAASNRLSTEALRATLDRDGIPWSRFRDRIRAELTLDRLREREVDSKIVVTDAEVDNFLDNNPDALSGVEYRLAHILLRLPENASTAQITALEARAKKVLARLAAGEDFARVAADSSDAPDNISGGEIGWRERDRLPGLYAEAAGKLEPGQISPPLRSAAGIHIVKLLAQRGGNGAEAYQVEQIHARHILLKPSEILSDTEAEGRLRALRERIINGADFAELAKASSADLSAAKGGDLGWLNPGDTVAEFEQAMNALAPGKISAPVRSPFGWHLIEVLERRVKDMSDERRKNAARAILRQRKGDEAYEEWLLRLRDETYVEYRIDS